MEITLKLEVSERLHAIAERFAALAERYLDGNAASAVPSDEPLSGDAYPWIRPGEAHAESAEIPLESVEPADAVNPPTEDKSDAQAQTSCEPEPVSDAPADDSPAEQEPDRPKSRRGRPRKAAKAEPTETTEIAPQEPEAVEAVNPPTEDASDAQAQTSCTPEPVSEPAGQTAVAASSTDAPDAPADAQDDPYNGMTLLGAVQNLLDEVREKGLELADVNARVRKECSARSLPFSSAACLMKAVGYTQARKIVLGE